MQNTSKQVVFILSSSHSGSTLLDMMLGSHSKCTSLGHFFWIDRQFRDADKERRYREDGLCSYCGKECKHWTEFEETCPENMFHEHAHQIFKTPILIDSSKKCWWIERNKPYINSEIKIIRLLRNGLDRIYSYKRLNGSVQRKDVVRWVAHEKNIRAYVKKQPSHIAVKYEDICDGDGLKQCCDYIGIRYNAIMRDFWKKKHHNIRGNVRTVAFMKSFHDNNVDKKYMEIAERGMKVEVQHNRKLLSDKDIKVFNRYGGGSFNRKLGYESIR